MMGNENDKMDFFVKIGEDEIKDIDVNGHIFKYKKRIIDDDLADYEDATDEEIVKDENGEEKLIRTTNVRKTVWCKFRNFVEVPYSQEEIHEITGINKAWSDFKRQEKDLLFMRLNKDIYHILLNAIDDINEDKKKSR